MKTWLVTVLMLLAAFGFIGSAAARDEKFAKRAPYRSIRWHDEQPSVELDRVWFELVAIDGRPTGEIVAFCKRTWPRQWVKRFEEDLVEVLSGMGAAPGDDVTLRLRDASGNEMDHYRVPMTEENRRAIWAAAEGRRVERTPAPPPSVEPMRRVVREHAAEVSAEFRDFARRVEGGGPPSATRLTRAQAEQDLDELEWRIENEYAYRDLRAVDYRAAFDAVRAGLGDGISPGAFAVHVQKLLALFGDGHSGVTDADLLLARGWLPLLLGVTADGLVAFDGDRKSLVDAERPYVVTIDDVPIERWLEAAGRYVAQGSPSWRREQSARFLRNIVQVRRELGLAESDRVRVTLGEGGGAKPRTVELPLALARPTYGSWPRTATRVLDGNVGYLRISKMESGDEFVGSLAAAMDSFRKTKGLVIDVRGNGGGSRHALVTLLPYFLGEGEKAAVVNVAAYRLREGDDAARPEGYLADRFLFPATSATWSDAERRAIARVAPSFRPAWQPPAGLFSAWHWLVISPSPSAKLRAYDRPVVVLLDGGCFSATDVFLGAFAGRPRVTLVGTPSGGGSGRAEVSRLANSGLTVRLATMASFRPDGRMYDGAGIEPDLRVDPRPGDFLGASDSQLDAALERLR